MEERGGVRRLTQAQARQAQKPIQLRLFSWGSGEKEQDRELTSRERTLYSLLAI